MKTETTTETDNVQGSVPRVTTVVRDSSGKEVSRIVSGGEGNSTEGDSAILSEISRNTGRTAKAAEGIQEAIKDGGQFSGHGPDGDPNQLYTPTDKTFTSVMQEFFTSVRSQPLFTAASAAFVATFPSCGCPTWDSGPINVMGHVIGSLKFDQLCSGFFINDVLPMVQAVVQILAAFVAIKWALL